MTDEWEEGLDVTRSEVVESELDRLIQERNDLRVAEEGERPAEVAWLASEPRSYALRVSYVMARRWWPMEIRKRPRGGHLPEVFLCRDPDSATTRQRKSMRKEEPTMRRLTQRTGGKA